MTTLAEDAPLSSLPMEVHAEAQAEADRFYGEGPATPWQPGGESFVSPKRIGIVVAAVVAIIIVLGLALATLRAIDPTAPEGLSPRAQLRGDIESPTGTGNPDDDIIDEPAPVSPPAPARVAMVPGSRQVAITRRGREWHIEAAGASRLFAAQRLAEATGSSLRGDVSLLATTRPLDLDWKGRGAAQAWQAVLGQELSFLTQCNAARCQVWLLQAGDGSAPVLDTPRAAIPMPTIEPVDVAAAPAVRPSDSPEPRVAAHHD